MVETSWTGDTRVEHRPGYIYPMCNIVATTPLYGNDTLMIQLDKIEFNS